MKPEFDAWAEFLNSPALKKKLDTLTPANTPQIMSTGSLFQESAKESDENGGDSFWGRSIKGEVDETGVDLIPERRRNAEGQSTYDRDYILRQGTIDLIYSINTSKPNLELKTIDLSWHHNDEVKLEADDLIDFGRELPYILYSDSDLGKPEEVLARAYISVLTSEDKRAKFQLVHPSDYMEFRNRLESFEPVKSIVFNFAEIKEGMPSFGFAFEPKDYFSHRVPMKLTVPLAYQWSPKVISFILEHHYDMDSVYQSSVSPAGFAARINKLSKQLIEEYYPQK